MRRIALLFFVVVTALTLNAQRLPDTVTPHHYILRFTPDLKAAKFSGAETIHRSEERRVGKECRL